MAQVYSFTTFSDGIAPALISDVHIAPAFDPKTSIPTQTSPFSQYEGIWDTGATASVITQRVVDDLNLKPTGMTEVHHAQGKTTAETYLVNIGLPNRVGLANVKVTKGNFTGGDVLIGMDVIVQGDFAVSNHKGKTAFTFRTPSVECIDFTGKGSAPNTMPQLTAKIGRNAPCSCGSGKKHKKCCGLKSGGPTNRHGGSST